jgi:hypothetical protein
MAKMVLTFISLEGKFSIGVRLISKVNRPTNAEWLIEIFLYETCMQRLERLVSRDSRIKNGDLAQRAEALVFSARRCCHRSRV